MELPKISLSEGSVLGGIKSKLGIGAKNNDNYNEDDSDYNQYETYNDDDANFDDTFGYADDYDSYDNQSYYQEEASDTRIGNPFASSGGVTRPRLVSLEDVRANTQLDTSPRSSEDDCSSYASDTSSNVVPAYDFESSAQELRSQGLNSLFNPTTSDSSSPSFGTFAQQPEANNATSQGASTEKPATDRPAVVSPLSVQPTLRPAGTSYEAYANPAARTPSGYARTLDVTRPKAYGDVEGIARTVRNGNIAILCLASTPGDLSKRLLDFSFGVASALSAHVECIGNKVFALYLGDALSNNEMQILKEQGVL